MNNKIWAIRTFTIRARKVYLSAHWTMFWGYISCTLSYLH